MEIVACFLHKYFSLLANNEIQAVKDLYTVDAIVNVNVDGEVETATGAELVEKVCGIFADGVVTISEAAKSSTNEVIVISASGVVASAEGAETSFTQTVTLASIAKHWVIVGEQLNITSPAEEEAVEEEQEEEAVPEPVVEKAPTPAAATPVKASKAEKEAAKAAEKEKVVEKAAPAPAAAAPKPASSWANALSSTSHAPAPKVSVTVQADAKPAPKVVVAPTTPVSPNDLIYFGVSITGNARLEKEKDVKKICDLVSAEVIAQMEKLGLGKKDTSRIHPTIKDPSSGRLSVFIDFVTPGAGDKLRNGTFTVFGSRVNIQTQNTKKQ